jgi:serine/threonine protein kinase
MLNTANRLEKNSMRKSPGTSNQTYKFKLTCQENIDENNDTRSWIKLMSQIDHTSGDYKIFTALLEDKKSIVVKIGNKNKLKDEYEIASALDKHKLPNFIKFFCFFSCLNKFEQIEKNTSICSTSGDEQGIIVMSNYELGQIDKYKWTRSNFDILKNVLKHIISSLLYAYEKYGFIHNDTHLGNILLKKSKKNLIIYNHDIQLPVIGILPVIMDFDRSKITAIPNDPDGSKFVYADIQRIFYLISSELDIKTNMTDKISILRTYISENTPISKDVYNSLFNIIDSIEISFIKSELKIPKWT